MEDFEAIPGFERDTGNRKDKWQKHAVTTSECEEAFFNLPMLVQPDLAHTKTETRYFILGQTDAGRHLFIVFTTGGDRIRVISARDSSRKERERALSAQFPEFKNEEEERTFWATHDSSKYVDWSQSQRVLFPNLKPSTRAISLRLPASMLDELRQMANQRDVPYQSLIKVFLRERIDLEYQRNFAVSDARASYPAKSKQEEEKRKKGTRKKLQ